MQLKYGNSPFDANSCDVAFRTQVRRDAAQRPYSRVTTIAVHGYLSAVGQAALSLQESNLKTALGRPYQDLVLYADDGSATTTALRNAGSLSGVVVTSGPNFPGRRGAEYATFREFEFEAEAEYPIAGIGAILEWEDRLEFTGGGPIFVHALAINTAPQKQQLWPATPYVVVQSGRAVGYRAYPPPAPQIFPQALKENPNGSLASPHRRVLGSEMFEITWRYVYESAFQLSGFPIQWPVNS